MQITAKGGKNSASTKFERVTGHFSVTHTHNHMKAISITNPPETLFTADIQKLFKEPPPSPRGYVLPEHLNQDVWLRAGMLSAGRTVYTQKIIWLTNFLNE